MFKHLNAIPSLGYMILPWSLLNLYKYAYAVANVANSQNVDLIHAHFAYPEGVAGLIGKRETGKSLVVTLHGYDLLTEPTVGYGVRLHRPHDALVRRVLEDADAIITASNATYREAQKAGVKQKKLYLIPNGVDTKRFDPSLDGDIIRERYGINDNFIVFTIRHHVPKNGIEYLIKSIPLVKEIKNVTFLIGGDGHLRRYHESLARKLGVSNNIIFTGSIPQKELPYYYVACDVFVIPSVIEAFGLVTTEAMACGKPVIGSRVGGICDVINDGVNGYLVKPKDVHAIADKILYLYEHQEEAREMGRMGRKIVEERFDINRKIDRILSLYEELLEN